MKKLFIILAAALSIFLCGAAFASPYAGFNADINHGNTQAVIGASSLIGPFGVEATHSTNYIIPNEYTVCSLQRCKSSTCSTEQIPGIKDTLAATASFPIAGKLTAMGRAGIGNKGDSYLIGASLSYSLLSNFHVRADWARYQINGNHQYIPMIGANVSI